MTELLTFLFGVIIHQTKPLTDRLPHGFDMIAKYSIGAVSGWLAFPFFARKYGMAENDIERGKTAFAMSFLFIGAGVVIGWLADTFHGGQA